MLFSLSDKDISSAIYNSLSTWVAQPIRKYLILKVEPQMIINGRFDIFNVL
jgi:hypothetical protein